MKTEFVKRAQATRITFAILLVSLLNACTSSDNLPDPIDNGATVTECDVSSVDCVAGQFIANDVIEGLDYECGNVHSVTDRDGWFTCPANSKVTFFIGFPESKIRIILGTTDIKQSNLPTGSGNLKRRPVILSPIDLAGAASAADPLGGARVLNIIRFLKALDSDGLDGSGRGWYEGPGGNYKRFQARNHILISSATRRLVTDASLVEKTMEASEFLDCDVLNDTGCKPCEGLTPPLPALPILPNEPGCGLGSKLQRFVEQSIRDNWVSSTPAGSTQPVDLLTIVPSKADARSQSEASLQAAAAGVYATQPLIMTCLTPLSESNSKAFYESGMCQGRAPDGRAGDMYLYVDRMGYGFGVGMEYEVQAEPVASSGSTNNPTLSNFLGAPRQFSMEADNAAAGAGRPIDYKTGLFGLKGEDTSGSPTQYAWAGKMRLGAIASTLDNYKALYSETLTVANSDWLGKWTIGTISPKVGQFMFVTRKPVNAWLDASVFTDVRFPMNISVKFRYHKSEADCPVPPGSTPTDDAELQEYLKKKYCKLLKVEGLNNDDVPLNRLYLTILPSGNIVTNTAATVAERSNCDVDESAFVPVRGASLSAETRVGFVSTVDGTELSLTLLFGRNMPYEDWRSVRAGVGGSLRVDTKASAPDSVFNYATPEVNGLGDSQGGWSNLWRVYPALVTGVADPMMEGIIEVEKVGSADGACVP